MEATTSRQRILFFAESVTLSQVVRLVTLARALDPERYELHFASAEFDDLAFAGTSFVRHRVYSIDPDDMMRGLRAGRRIYEESTLVRYVADDLRVLRTVQPHLVVSDFRLSMSVSARVAGVRHAALLNAYFSPYAVRDAGFPIPDHPMVDLMGPELATLYFPKAIPFVFAHFSEPVQALRRRYGLTASGSLLEVLTDADHVLFPDTPSLVPTRGAPVTHEYLGPVIWSPPSPLPAWWESLPVDKPVVYATLGSSGNLDALPSVLGALKNMNVTGVVATAGRKLSVTTPANVFMADFLPGDVVARRAAVVVSNGGSSTSYQALAEGTPVVGIASNFDQYLSMTSTQAAGAGRLVRAAHVTEDTVGAAVSAVLTEPSYRAGAARIRADFARHDAGARFASFVARALALPPREQAAPRARRGLRAWLAGLGVVTCALVAPGARAGDPPKAPPRTAPPAVTTGDIRFTADVNGTQGHVVCALFTRNGWLKNPVKHVKGDIKAKSSECVFSTVEPGVYGIVAFHDENDDGQIDKGLFGIPTEDWCASRNATGFMGPPSFENAKFAFKGGVVRLRAHM